MLAAHALICVVAGVPPRVLSTCTEHGQDSGVTFQGATASQQFELEVGTPLSGGLVMRRGEGEVGDQSWRPIGQHTGRD